EATGFCPDLWRAAGYLCGEADPGARLPHSAGQGPTAAGAPQEEGRAHPGNDAAVTGGALFVFRKLHMRSLSAVGLVLWACSSSFATSEQSPGLEKVRVAKDGKSFVLAPSGKAFVPWGFNYDHDTQGRLLEDYWEGEWDAVERHFAQMKKLGANAVRIHL